MEEESFRFLETVLEESVLERWSPTFSTDLRMTSSNSSLMLSRKGESTWTSVGIIVIKEGGAGGFRNASELRDPTSGNEDVPEEEEAPAEDAGGASNS